MGALEDLHTKDDTGVPTSNGAAAHPSSSPLAGAVLSRSNSTGHSRWGQTAPSVASAPGNLGVNLSRLDNGDGSPELRSGAQVANGHYVTAVTPGFDGNVDAAARSGGGASPSGAKAAKREVLGSGRPLSKVHSVSATSLQEQDSLELRVPHPVSIPESPTTSRSHASPAHTSSNPFLNQPAGVVVHPLQQPPAVTTGRSHSFSGHANGGRSLEIPISQWQHSSTLPPTPPPNLPPASEQNPPTGRTFQRRPSDPFSDPGGRLSTSFPQTWVNPLSSEISLSAAQSEKPRFSGLPGEGRPLSPRETRITVEASPRTTRFAQSEGTAATKVKHSDGGDSDDDDGGPLLQAWRSGNLPLEMRSDSTLGRFNKRLPSLRVPNRAADSPREPQKGQPNSADSLDKIDLASRSGHLSPNLGRNLGSQDIDDGPATPKPMPSRVFTRTKTSRLGDPRENGMFASKETMVRKTDAVAKSGVLRRSGVLASPNKSGVLNKSGALKKSGLLGRLKTNVRSGQLPKKEALERVEEDEDPLEGEDLPEDFWAEQNKCSWFTTLQWVALVGDCIVGCLV
jgi:hypothetical protein